MQVETGKSKLLLLETFSFFYFFFTLASSRGARTPKNDFYVGVIIVNWLIKKSCPLILFQINHLVPLPQSHLWMPPYILHFQTQQQPDLPITTSTHFLHYILLTKGFPTVTNQQGGTHGISHQFLPTYVQNFHGCDVPKCAHKSSLIWSYLYK